MNREAIEASDLVTEAMCEAGVVYMSNNGSDLRHLNWPAYAGELYLAMHAARPSQPADVERAEAVVSEWWDKLKVYADGGAPDRANVTRAKLAEIVIAAMQSNGEG